MDKIRGAFEAVIVVLYFLGPVAVIVGLIGVYSNSDALKAVTVLVLLLGLIGTALSSWLSEREWRKSEHQWKGGESAGKILRRREWEEKKQRRQEYLMEAIRKGKLKGKKRDKCRKS